MSKPTIFSIPRHEFFSLLGICLLGIILRCWDLSALSVEHFDEGVYASNIWFTLEEGYRYPDRHLYAPPLLPAIIEWSQTFFGVGPVVVCMASLLAGCSSIPMIWWFGRRIAGPIAGLTSALLLATNEVHILYSRLALTEALLCFCMLLAVSLFHCATLDWKANAQTTKRSVGLALLSGFIAGLGWLTKYNGWLSLAIMLSGGLAWGVFTRLDIREWKRFGGHVLMTVGVTLCLWLPYLSSLQKFGGYEAVAGNHRQYFVDLAGWPVSAAEQLIHQLGLISWTTVSGFVVLGVILILAKPVSRWIPSVITCYENPSKLGMWLTASWLIGLSVAIPLYTPYPRLMVPWWVVLCLAAGTVTSLVVRRIAVGNKHDEAETPPLSAKTLIAIPVVLLLAVVSPLRNAPAWEDHAALAKITEQIIQEAGKVAQASGRQPEEVLFYIYGEPAIYYHISAANRLAGPIGHLDFAAPTARQNGNYPTFLITGPHAYASPLFAEQWQNLGEHFTRIESWPYKPSTYIQMNEKVEPPYEKTIILYHLKPLQ